MNVFIVDDSIVVQQALTALLTRLAGVKVIGCGIDVLLVIIYTAFPLPHLRGQNRNAGADFFFDKTAEVELLASTVKKLAQYFPVGSRL